MVRGRFHAEFNVNIRDAHKTMLYWVFEALWEYVKHFDTAIIQTTAVVDIQQWSQRQIPTLMPCATKPLKVQRCLTPEFNNFGFLFCCKHYSSYKLEFHLYKNKKLSGAKLEKIKGIGSKT